MTNTLPHSGQRSVIAIIGNRNAGKSTLLNKITEQDVSIVSDTPGTTTDAIAKAYELIPAGPVTFYDTAGLDDEGELGNKRIKAAEKIIKKADLILYVVGKDGLDGTVEEEIRKIHLQGKPYIPVFNFADSYEPDKYTKAVMQLYQGIRVSALTGEGIAELKQRMCEKIKEMNQSPKIISDLIDPQDIIVLVTPIDNAAPKGRMIMPQVQVIREILDNNAIVIVTQPDELQKSLSALKKSPRLVITDSQAVKKVTEIVPEDVEVTTFSMLFARAKWDFKQLSEGFNAISQLKNGSKVLIAEGCSHHVTCDDIGRVKIPQFLKNYTKKDLDIDFVTGTDFPEDLSNYDLVIHCGGCMLNIGEIKNRLRQCAEQNVAITNYGIVISLTQGVLDRVIMPLI